MATKQSTEWGGIWEVLGCKWTFHILRFLAVRDARFNQIKDAIDGLPASTLSTRLKALEAEQIVSRTVEDSSPPSVEYSLTEKGLELAAIIDEIENLEKRYD